jgi:hypothetical protein
MIAKRCNNWLLIHFFYYRHVAFKSGKSMFPKTEQGNMAVDSSIDYLDTYAVRIFSTFFTL